MALNHNDVELPELIINHFNTLSDYQAAYQAGFISGTDITFIDENIQADWDETDSGSPAYIKNKPVISGGGTSVQSNWAQNDPSAADYIKNKPTIPASVTGTNDGTNWTTITIGDTTKNIPSDGGGGGSSTLVGLTDTSISSPSSGQILAYDSSTSKWVNTTEKDPTVPAWAKAANKPSYTASEVGALATGTTLDNIPDGSTRKLSNFISSSNTVSALNTKVDKVNGKALSTNDFSDAYKGKLDNIASGADVNVQADWAETGTTNDAYIKNKPSIPNGIATSAVSGYMSAEMVSKLNDSASILWCEITRGSRISGDTIATYNCTVDKTHAEITGAAMSNKVIVGYSTIVGDTDYYQNFYSCNLAGSTSRGTGTVFVSDNVSVFYSYSDNKWYYVVDNDTRKFTYGEAEKLSGIESGAQVNIQADWSQTATTADDYIKNKPNYATSLDLSINNNTFVITGQLKDQNGNNLGTAQTIDLPLESVVVDGTYIASAKTVQLTLQSGSTVEFSIADLVSGLQNELTSSNKLNADYIQDGTTNKVYTVTEQTKLSGIESGAQKNGNAYKIVQVNDSTSNCTATTSADTFIISAGTNVTLTRGTKKVTISSTDTKPGTLTTTATTSLSTATNESLSGNVSLHKVSKTGSYNDLNDKPIPTVSSSDAGKILQVSSAGTWQLVSPVTIYSGTGTPAQNLGKDGDIYIQTT